MEKQLFRDIPISIYPPIMLYNKDDIKTIWSTKDENNLDAILYIHIPFVLENVIFVILLHSPVVKK